MRVEERIHALFALGNHLRSISEKEKTDIFSQAEAENPWFTQPNLDMAWHGLLHYLDREKLNKWTSRYSLAPAHPKKTGLIMAGNIPLAGIHDLLAVLVSGHFALAKLSSQDTVLPNFFIKSLIEIQPDLGLRITLAERLNNVEAVIATGSDNSSRYFDYYFSKVPHIIRKNRTSCAILSGEESAADLILLGNDLFSYFGLGCRNVSKLFVPYGYNLIPLLDAIQSFSYLSHHSKYRNNYDYQRSILLINNELHLDSGFSLFKNNKEMVSPVSMIFYEEYNNEADLSQKLLAHSAKIQAIASLKGQYPRSTPFGQLQFPELWDYADGIDTLNFLSSI